MLLAVGLLAGCKGSSNSGNSSTATKFCGWATEGPCESNQDCIIGGCSSQVCQSKKDEPVITTCDWKECYQSDDYYLDCKCDEGKCRWK